MEDLVKNPLGFILAVALAPDYEFSNDEISKLESNIKNLNRPLNRTVKGSVMVWTLETKEEPAWTPGKPVEGITSLTSPFIMGGHGTFWPLPLQRHRLYTTKMWRVTLPENLTAIWLNKLEKAIEKEWDGLFWTLSKR